MNAIAVWACAGMLAVGALLVLARITIGPTVLDRAVAFDVLVAITVIGIALHAAVRRSTDTLAVLVVLTLLGLVGSVAVARFIDPSSVDHGVEFGDEPGPAGADPARGELQ